ASKLRMFADVLAQPEDAMNEVAVAPLFRALDEWTLAVADYCLKREPTLDLTGALPKPVVARSGQKAAVAQAA
ncbi:MAG: hypothetical protein MUF80_07240, partial [Burkholderiales bacterium]|nr:hypothetical protein [Burkholderiales bacterium]